MPVTVNKIDTSVVAETLRQQIREDVAIVPGARPRLVGFLANKDPAARKYAEWTGRACTKDGIDYVLKEVEACDLEGALKEANEDAGVHGILLCIIQNFTAPSCGIVASTSTPSTRRLLDSVAVHPTHWLICTQASSSTTPSSARSRLFMEGPWTTS